MSVPWTIKHKPKTISEMVGSSNGNGKAIQQFIAWMRSWESGVPKKKAALIYGPPGIGKTLLVETFAREHGYDLIELNASDQRSESIIQRVVGAASQQSTLFGTGKRLILLDEIDGITGKEDAGGLFAILKAIKDTRIPIVLIANDAWNPRFAALRSVCEMIEMKRLPTRLIVPYLKKICQKEGIEASDDALKLIAERSAGDVRSAINDLQAAAQGRKKLTKEDVAWLAYRDRQEQIFNVLRLIFTAKTVRGAKMALSLSDVDYNMLFEWIYENVPHQLTDLEDMYRAMEALAKTDLYLKLAKREQAWELLSYAFDLMTGGVALAREKTKPKWVPFKFPERIKLMSKTKEVREVQSRLAQKIKQKCHISSASALRDVVPFLRVIFEEKPEHAAGLAKWLRLDLDEIAFLTQNNKLAQEIAELAGVKK